MGHSIYRRDTLSNRLLRYWKLQPVKLEDVRVRTQHSKESMLAYLRFFITADKATVNRKTNESVMVQEYFYKVTKYNVLHKNTILMSYIILFVHKYNSICSHIWRDVLAWNTEIFVSSEANYLNENIWNVKESPCLQERHCIRRTGRKSDIVWSFFLRVCISLTR